MPEVDPPEELYQVAKEKCFGLKITPDKLNHIRKERLKSLGLSDGATYANINRIQEEINHFEEVISKINCQVIDVSNKAIEETANIIVNAVQNQKCFSTFTKGECAFFARVKSDTYGFCNRL